MSASDGEPVTVQDVYDRLGEIQEALEAAYDQHDKRINDLTELVQEMDEKLDEIQDSLDEIAGFEGGS